MALTVQNFADPRDPAHPLASAYAWLSFLALDLRGGTGRIVFDVHSSEAAWRGIPIGQVAAQLGQGVGSTYFPSLDDLMGDPEFAAAYATIGSKLYTHAMAALPAFEGATPA